MSDKEKYRYNKDEGILDPELASENKIAFDGVFGREDWVELLKFT